MALSQVKYIDRSAGLANSDIKVVSTAIDEV